VFYQVENEIRFKQKHYRFKSIFPHASEIITTSIIDGKILFLGELTGEITETRADCIFYSWILCIHRYRILSAAILPGSRGISEQLVTRIFMFWIIILEVTQQ
jgi:hypothetical protein